MEGFLSAIGLWCVITLLVFWIFRLYNSIWAFVSTPEVFRITGAYVVLGVILGGAGVYEKLVDFAGAGATVPLTGFGYNLAKGVKQAVQEDGWLGVLTGGLKAAAGGISAAVFFGFLAALLCKPKDKS